MTRVQFCLFFLGFAIIFASSGYGQVGCCANILVPEREYCVANSLTSDSCCSRSFAYNPTNSYLPGSVSDCLNSYWYDGSCNPLKLDSSGKCYVGCCLIYEGYCVGLPQNICLDSAYGRRGQSWTAGFPSDNPCYNSLNIAAISQCENSGHASSCTDYRNSETCTAGSCFWCQNKCVSNCQYECPALPVPSPERVCQPKAVVDCTALTIQQQCTSSGCKWCPLGTCVKDCASCTGFVNDAEPPLNVCDSGRTECNDGFDDDGDGFTDLDDFCCASGSDTTEDNSCSCTDTGKGYCCADYKSQCSDAAGRSVNLLHSFNSASCKGVCCNQPCFQIPSCTSGVRVRSVSLPPLYTGPFCMCGAAKVNMSNPVQKEKYCCSGILQDGACSTIRFSGSVADPSGNLLYPADISLQGADTYQFKNINPPGDFLQNIVAGTYVLTVVMPGFLQHTETIAVAQDMVKKIVLQPIDPTCSVNWAPVTITASVARCTPRVDISWDYACRSRVLAYILTRDNKEIFSTRDIGTTSYSDDSVGWGKTYTYQVVAKNTFGQNKSVQFSVYTGSEACDGRCTGEQFCISEKGLPLQRAVCGPDNVVSVLGDCSPGVCVGPESSGNTHCVVPEICQSTGVPGNYFGMYTSEQACLSNGNTPRYCYYDYSETTIDSCRNCTTNMFCYDYRSSGACQTDNCRVTRNNAFYDCTWYGDAAFNELGKGICFAPRYAGNEYCGLCGDNSRLFANTHCSSVACDLLGNCFANRTLDNCIRCMMPPDKAATACEDLPDRRSCIGSIGIVQDTEQQFSIPSCYAVASVRSANSFVASNDACSIGKCKWNALESSCFKDANDDASPDCAKTDTACQRDTASPVTTVKSKPEKISRVSSGDVVFSVQDYGYGSAQPVYRTFFCIDSTNTCCPDSEIIGNSITASAAIPALVRVENPAMNLRFFSVDSHGNVESVKYTALNVDTIPPGFGISYTLSNTTGTSDKSNLLVTITSSEPVSGAKDSLQNIATGQKVGKLSNSMISPSVPAVAAFTSLQDGFYLYTVQAADSFGNVNITELRYVTVDRVHLIINPQPVAKRFLPKDNVALSVETIGQQMDCFHKLSTGARLRFSAVSPSGANFFYQSVLSNLASGSYLYNVECELNSRIIDSLPLFFTVDGIAPATKIFYEASTGRFVPYNPNLWYKNLKLLFVCNDSSPLLSGEPGPFGCAATYYCTDTANSCTPQTKVPANGIVDLSKNSRSFYLRYYSKDSGNNTESMRSSLIRVDNASPTVTITSPRNGTVVDNPSILVAGTWSDSAGTVDLTITLAHSQGGDFTRITSSSGTFSVPVTLGPGRNIIYVTGIDTGVSGGRNVGDSLPVVVFHDTVGPVFSGARIYNHLKKRLDDGTNKAEYSQRINFSVKILDPEWSRNIRLARLTVQCRNQSFCGSYNKIFTMVQSGDSFSYLLDPLVSGILHEGSYSAVYHAEDRFGNINTLEQGFDVVDKSSLAASVRNHLGQDIGKGSFRAEYGLPVRFSAKPSNLNASLTLRVFVECVNLSSCGNYSKWFSLVRQEGSFNYTLMPNVSGALLPGKYNASFVATDLWSKVMNLELSFRVSDTSKLAATISNHLGQRIDQGSYKADYGREIIFAIAPSEPRLVSSVMLTLVCTNQSVCGSYRAEFVATSNRTGFVYTLIPAKNQLGVYLPDVGKYNALFVVQDIFGMYRTVLSEFSIADASSARVNITISAQHFNEKGQPRLGIGVDSCLWYSVVLSSDKPLNVTMLLAEIFRYNGRQPPAIDFVNMPSPQVSLQRNVWSYQLCIPYENLVYLFQRGNNTRFVLEAFDLHGRGISERDIVFGRFFEIDTHGGDPPTLLTRIPLVYYTNAKQLNIVGITSPPEPATVYLNLSGRLYQTTTSPLSRLIAEEKVFSDVPAGVNIVEVFGNRETVFSRGFLKFSHNRTGGRYYRIVSSSYSIASQTTRLTIEPGLELPVRTSEKLSVFELELPTGLFTFSVNLESQGNNSLSIWAVDDFKNRGLPAKRTIVYDNQPFSLLSYLPADGTVFAEKRPNITVSIDDDSINLSSVTLSINSQIFRCGTLKCALQGSVLTVTYRPIANLEDGNYSMVFRAGDITGNRNSFSWQFSVDSTVPVLKSFEVLGGYYFQAPFNRWYTNSSRIRIRAVFEDGPVNGSLSITQIPSITFDCSLGITPNQVLCSASQPVPDGQYTLTGTLRRYLGSGWSNSAKLSYSVSVDTVKPNVSIDDSPPLQSLTRAVTGTYKDANMDTNDEITVFGSQLKNSVAASKTSGRFSAEVFLLDTTIDGTYRIFARAVDKAGNSMTGQSDLVYDTSAGSIQILSVSASRPDMIVVRLNNSYYATNAGSASAGIIIKGLVEPGTLKIFTSHETGTGVSKELLQKTIKTSAAFSANLTLGQKNGKNYVRFMHNDLAGNNASLLIFIDSDVTGPASPIILLEKGAATIARIGSTGWRGGPPAESPDYCMQLLTEVERDSCIINLLLNARRDVCSYISNPMLRLSCEAVS